MMVTKIKVFASIITVLVAFSGIALGADAPKIGVIDFKAILEKSKSGLKAQEEIKIEGQKMEKDFKAKTEEIEKLEAQLERESMVMSNEKREEKLREIRIKRNDLKGLRKQYMEKLRRLEAQIVGRIEKEVVKVVNEIGKADGYTLILDRRIGGVVFAPDAIEITDKVIEEHDKRAGKKS